MSVAPLQKLVSFEPKQHRYPMAWQHPQALRRLRQVWMANRLVLRTNPSTCNPGIWDAVAGVYDWRTTDDVWERWRPCDGRLLEMVFETQNQD